MKIAKKIIKILTSISLFGLMSCNSSRCDHANFEYYKNDKPIEGFQLLLHSVTEKRLELIGKNYLNDEFWQFTSRNYIIINGKLKINIDEEFFKDDKKVDYFYSSELTKFQFDFLITDDIETIEIHNGSEKHFANLTKEQSRKFYDVLNCNYRNDKEQLNDLRK